MIAHYYTMPSYLDTRRIVTKLLILSSRPTPSGILVVRVLEEAVKVLLHLLLLSRPMSQMKAESLFSIYFSSCCSCSSTPSTSTRGGGGVIKSFLFVGEVRWMTWVQLRGCTRTGPVSLQLWSSNISEYYSWILLLNMSDVVECNHSNTVEFVRKFNPHFWWKLLKTWTLIFFTKKEELSLLCDEWAAFKK